MEKTLIRIGNDEYASHNGSYGLTSLRDNHARIAGQKVRFEFRGKGGLCHSIDLENPRLAKVIRRSRELPGRELFQYVGENGQVCDVSSSDVNEYLRDASGGDFTAKDFRTWAGTVLAAQALREIEPGHSRTQNKRNIVRAVEHVAMRLGNTKAVCRRCYVHPAIIDSYLDGTLVKQLKQRAGQMLRESGKGLPADEAAVLALLSRRLGRPAAQPARSSRAA